MEKDLLLMVDKMEELSTYLLSEYKWEEHESVIELVALEYVLNHNRFDKEKYEDLQLYIKSNTNILYNSSEYQRTATAAILINKYKNPKAAFIKLLEYEDKMNKVGFKKGYYLAIAVYALMNISHNKYAEDRIDRAMKIYKEMKKKHFWFTKEYNYPLAIILSKSSKPLSRIVKETENYYNELYKAGLKKTSGLQILSYILLMSSENIEKKVQRCEKMLKYVGENNLRVHSIHYSTIGILTLMGDEGEIILKEILKIVKKVKEEKKLNWIRKEIEFFIVSSIVIKYYIDNRKDKNPILKTGVQADLISFMAEQNAIMVASSVGKYLISN